MSAVVSQLLRKKSEAPSTQVDTGPTVATKRMVLARMNLLHGNVLTIRDLCLLANMTEPAVRSALSPEQALIVWRNTQKS